MKKYRKRPLEVQVAKWDGEKIDGMYPLAFFDQYSQNWHYGRYGGQAPGRKIIIHTLEGEMECLPGDYVIQGIHGEFYPVKPKIFNESYEEAEADNSSCEEL